MWVKIIIKISNENEVGIEINKWEETEVDNYNNMAWCNQAAYNGIDTDVTIS